MFPDPNVGYVFGYKSEVCDDGIAVTFLRGLIRIVFRYEDIESARIKTYRGGRISWNVIRWGKCPNGTKALQIRLRRGIFRDHLIVFENLDEAVEKLGRFVEVIE
jgi:hypothetical protein